MMRHVQKVELEIGRRNTGQIYNELLVSLPESQSGATRAPDANWTLRISAGFKKRS